MKLTQLWLTVNHFLSQVENTIRWRVKRDEEGNETRESNARIVKWSDGRYVLIVNLFLRLIAGPTQLSTLLLLLLLVLQHVSPPGE